MSGEEPETEAGAANDATEGVDDDFSTRLRNVAGSQAETPEAWSDEDDAADDAESKSQPSSVVTGHSRHRARPSLANRCRANARNSQGLHEDLPSGVREPSHVGRSAVAKQALAEKS